MEVSSFNSVLSHYADFAIARSDDLLRYHDAAPSEVAGALGVFRAQGQVEVVPTYSARALSLAGTLAAADWVRRWPDAAQKDRRSGRGALDRGFAAASISIP